MSSWNLEIPPHPTAETVLDSEEETEDKHDRFKTGSHKPSKGGVDTSFVKPKRSNSERKENKSHNSMKEKSSRSKWSLNLGGDSNSKRPQLKQRTMSMSAVGKSADILPTKKQGPAPAPSAGAPSHQNQRASSPKTTQTTVKTSSKTVDPLNSDTLFKTFEVNKQKNNNNINNTSLPTPISTPKSASPPPSYAQPVSSEHIPSTPVSPASSTYNMAPRKTKQAAVPETVAVAPSSVISGSSDSPSSRSASSGSIFSNPSNPDDPSASYNRYSNLYYNEDNTVPPSPMPEAPAPPPGRAFGAQSSDDDSTSSVDEHEDYSAPYVSSSSLPTPRAAIPVMGRPGHVRHQSGSGSTARMFTTGSNQGSAPKYTSEYDLDTQGTSPTRKRGSFSSNGTTVPLSSSNPTTGLGIGLDSSVFEFLDEGEEDAAATALPKAEEPENTPTSAHASKPTSPVKPTSGYNAQTSPSGPSPYGSYFPSQYPRYSAYGAPSDFKIDETISSAPVSQTANISEEYPGVAESAIVHTPQKASFKESLKARRDAAAAAAAAAAEAVTIEEYPEDDYAYQQQQQQHQQQRQQQQQQQPQQPPQPKRGRRMPPQSQSYAPQPDYYGTYGAVPTPYNPAPYGAYTNQAPPAPSAHPMYGARPQHMRHQSMPHPSAASGVPMGHMGGYETPPYSMMNTNVSELATTVLGGRYAAHMGQAGQRHPMAPSALGSNVSTYQPAAAAPYGNNFYAYDQGYYDEQGYYEEQPEYEVTSPPASPEYGSKRPMSSDFAGTKRNSMPMGQWTAEWAETDSQRTSSRPPIDRKPTASGEREELELGKDGLEDPTWSKPQRPRRRTTNDKSFLSATFSDSSSKMSANIPNPSRLETFREEQEKEGPKRPTVNAYPSTQRNGLPTPEDSPSSASLPGMPKRTNPRSTTSHSSAYTPAPRNATLATIKTSLGYPHLSNHLASTPSTAVYRRFDKLNHRILLHLQDEICELETLLEGLDTMEQFSNTGGAGLRTRRGSARISPNADNTGARRLELMGAIFVKLQQYNQALTTYSKLVNVVPGATKENVESYRQWMTIHQPIVPEEMDFLFKADDFAALSGESLGSPLATPIYRQESRAASVSRSGETTTAIVDSGINWMKNQDITVQLSVLVAFFFVLPLILFLSTNTTLGRLLLVMMLFSGFCYFASMILFNSDHKSDAVPSAAPAVDAFGTAPFAKTHTA